MHCCKARCVGLPAACVLPRAAALADHLLQCLGSGLSGLVCFPPNFLVLLVCAGAEGVGQVGRSARVRVAREGPGRHGRKVLRQELLAHRQATVTATQTCKWSAQHSWSQRGILSGGCGDGSSGGSCSGGGEATEY